VLAAIHRATPDFRTVPNLNSLYSVASTPRRLRSLVAASSQRSKLRGHWLAVLSGFAGPELKLFSSGYGNTLLEGNIGGAAEGGGR
jgi:predicted amino acid racemase